MNQSYTKSKGESYTRILSGKKKKKDPKYCMILQTECSKQGKTKLYCLGIHAQGGKNLNKSKEITTIKVRKWFLLGVVMTKKDT